MKKLISLIFIVGLTVSVFASPLAVNVYTGSTSQSPVKQGAKSVTFDMVGFTGTIGNASFSNVTLAFPITATQDGDRLNDISYTVTSGTLIIVDVR